MSLPKKTFFVLNNSSKDFFLVWHLLLGFARSCLLFCFFVFFLNNLFGDNLPINLMLLDLDDQWTKTHSDIHPPFNFITLPSRPQEVDTSHFLYVKKSFVQDLVSRMVPWAPGRTHGTKWWEFEIHRPYCFACHLLLSERPSWTKHLLQFLYIVEHGQSGELTG